MAFSNSFPAAVLCLLAAIGAAAEATPVTLPRTEVRTLSCPDNGVAYRLDIALPRGFARTPAQDWPLLVVLDSDYAFAIARNVVEHLSDRQDLPPLLVVGIGYVGSTTEDHYRRHRTRDYTPSPSPDGGYGPSYQKISGGGPAFLACLAKRILPLLERQYRAGHPRVLSGHSYGGLFTAWTLLTEPGLFDGYLMVSPSLWYDRQLARKLAERRSDSLRTALTAKVYGGVGALEVNARWGMPQELAIFDAALRRIAAPDLCLRTENLDHETHNSVYPRALSNGLRFLWATRDGQRPFSPCPPAQRH